jgi:hypothetical protein
MLFFIQVQDDVSFSTVFKKDCPEASVSFSFSGIIKALYRDNFYLYLINNEGTQYISTNEKSDNNLVYFVFFNYDEYKEREAAAETADEIEALQRFDIRTIPVDIFTYLDILKKANGGMINGSDMEGANFIFYITGDEVKRTWIIIGDDERRDNTFQQITEAFDIG